MIDRVTAKLNRKRYHNVEEVPPTELTRGLFLALFDAVAGKTVVSNQEFRPNQN
jgi:hypothetical protein